MESQQRHDLPLPHGPRCRPGAGAETRLTAAGPAAGQEPSCDGRVGARSRRHLLKAEQLTGVPGPTSVELAHEMSGQVAAFASLLPQIILGGWKQHMSLCGGVGSAPRGRAAAHQHILVSMGLPFPKLKEPCACRCLPARPRAERCPVYLHQRSRAPVLKPGLSSCQG